MFQQNYVENYINVCIHLGFSETAMYTGLINTLGVNSEDQNGETLLYKSVLHNHKNGFHLLLIKGANINIENLNGHSVFDLIEEIENNRDKEEFLNIINGININ